MNINPPSDDAKLRALSRGRKLSGELEPVNPLEATAPPQPIEKDKPRQIRSRREQRQQNRRKKKQKVLLDTRQDQDRRTQFRRKDATETEPSAETTTHRGIDVRA